MNPETVKAATGTLAFLFELVAFLFAMSGQLLVAVFLALIGALNYGLFEQARRGLQK